MILLDANILVRLSDNQDKDYLATKQAIAGCWRKGEELFVSDQSLQEFWMVATRSRQKNGLGMDVSRADRFQSRWMRMFTPCADPDRMFETWRTLVKANAITGIRAFDARHAALAQAYGFRLLTYNLQDFTTFSINVVDPKNPATW